MVHYVNNEIYTHRSASYLRDQKRIQNPETRFIYVIESQSLHLWIIIAILFSMRIAMIIVLVAFL